MTAPQSVGPHSPIVVDINSSIFSMKNNKTELVQQSNEQEKRLKRARPQTTN